MNRPKVQVRLAGRKNRHGARMIPAPAGHVQSHLPLKYDGQSEKKLPVAILLRRDERNEGQKNDVQKREDQWNRNGPADPKLDKSKIPSVQTKSSRARCVHHAKKHRANDHLAQPSRSVQNSRSVRNSRNELNSHRVPSALRVRNNRHVVAVPIQIDRRLIG